MTITNLNVLAFLPGQFAATYAADNKITQTDIATINKIKSDFDAKVLLDNQKRFYPLIFDTQENAIDFANTGLLVKQTYANSNIFNIVDPKTKKKIAAIWLPIGIDTLVGNGRAYKDFTYNGDYNPLNDPLPPASRIVIIRDKNGKYIPAGRFIVDEKPVDFSTSNRHTYWGREYANLDWIKQNASALPGITEVGFFLSNDAIKNKNFAWKKKEYRGEQFGMTGILGPIGQIIGIAAFAFPVLQPFAIALNVGAAIESGNVVNAALAVLNMTNIPNSLAQSILPGGTPPIAIKGAIGATETAIQGGNPLIGAAGSTLPGLANTTVQNIFSTTIDTPGTTLYTQTTNTGAPKMDWNNLNNDQYTSGDFLFIDPTDFGLPDFTPANTGGTAWDNFLSSDSSSSIPLTNTDIYTSGNNVTLPSVVTPGQFGIFAGDIAKTITGLAVQYVAAKNAAGQSILKAQPIQKTTPAANVLPAKTVVAKPTTTLDTVSSAVKSYGVPIALFAAFIALKG